MNSFALSGVVEQDMLKDILAESFHVLQADVFVCETEEGLLNAPPDNPVNVVWRKLPGDFPMWIDVYSTLDPTSDADIAAAFVTECKIDALISDSTPNPYQWIQVCAPDGRKALVHVDVNQLDDRDAFVIARMVKWL
jgi:hypothetical protein